MTRYLLDTNIISNVIKPEPSQALLAWLGGQKDDDLDPLKFFQSKKEIDCSQCIQCGIKSKACTDKGKPAIQVFRFDAQDQATNAVVLGQVDAMSADSPVTLYAIAKTGGKLQTAGTTFDVAPYGIPVAKGSDFGPVLQKTVQALIADGTYGKILDKWGVADGGVKTVDFNAASKG